MAAGLSLRPGYDWFFPYYRDRALCLDARHDPSRIILLQAVGAADDPASGGRQMPSHWSDPELHIVTQSSSTATQCLQAVGCAEATLYLARNPQAPKLRRANPIPTASTTASSTTWSSTATRSCTSPIGEGATSQGEFWETLNIACNGKLPLLFVVEDNGYAISVPVEVNTPGGNISRLLAEFSELPL